MICTGTRVTTIRKISKRGVTIREGFHGMVSRVDADEVYVKFEDNSLIWVD